MARLHINQDKVTAEVAEKLISLCPFSAISYENGKLEVSSGCKMCKMCIKKGPQGVIELIEDAPKASVDKSAWRGICVYADHSKGKIHNVTFELIGKAKELAKVTGHPVYVLMLGSDVQKCAQELLHYGVDKVFTYDYPELEYFKIEPYAAAFEDFISKIKPSSILVGATNLGRSLAPRVAAHFRTGLTADCTILEMKENTDLLQIRPAFGGNIMAQIVTPNNRPQFCTARYKIFSASTPSKETSGEIVSMQMEKKMLNSNIEIISTVEKPKEIDISEAETIVAVGRGIRTRDDLAMVKRLADFLGAQMACTRPLVECGWFDAKHQIGLSGRTVQAKLIITVGISGSVQFAAGMRGSERIVAINSDPNASIFDVAHYGLTGDLYEIIPRLIEKIGEGTSHAV